MYIQINPKLGRASITFGLDSVTLRSNPIVSVHPDAPRHVGQEGGGPLPAGYDIRAELWIWYQGSISEASLAPIEMPVVTATVHVDGRPPVMLDADVEPWNGSLWRLRLSPTPDVDAPAVIELRVEWVDRCFSYAATGMLEVSLASTTTTAGCGIGENKYRDDLAAALAEPIQVGEEGVRLRSPRNESRYLPVGSPGIDVHPAFAWYRDDPLITTEPGQVVRARRDQPGFELLTLRSVVWTRRSFVEAAKGWPPTGLVEVSDRSHDSQPDGSFRFRAPDKPGRYVTLFLFEYDWTCGTGEAWAVFSLDVD